jgi:hypothetical protein
MSKPYLVWRDGNGRHQCLSDARWYVKPSLIVAWFDDYKTGAAYARSANTDEASRRRKAERERAKAESKQGELAI